MNGSLCYLKNITNKNVDINLLKFNGLWRDSFHEFKLEMQKKKKSGQIEMCWMEGLVFLIPKTCFISCKTRETFQ